MHRAAEVARLVSLGATAVFAWPGAEVAVMGAKAAVGILHRKKLAAATHGQHHIETVWGRGYVLRDPDEQAEAA